MTGPIAVPRLILASASPRRRELLTQLGVAFDVVVAEVTEHEEASTDPRVMVAHNAALKADWVAARHPRAVVLGADTTVFIEGTALNKPRDGSEARAMLRRLSGRTHTVFTGLAVRRAEDGLRIDEGVATEVTFKVLDEAVIETYLARVNTLDKAGGYAVQGRAAAFIRHIAGSYSGIMGLPLYETWELLAPMLGTSLAPTLFAIALIASGQSSTITGTLAGQIVMEGYLQLRITPWVRRLMTRLIAVVPAVIVILINGENNIDSLLVFSQVILSMQLGFAIIPLIHFTSDRKTMGVFTIKPWVIVLASLITLVLVYLNLRMVYEQASVFFENSDSIWAKALIIAGALAYITLLLMAIFYPLFVKVTSEEEISVHPLPEKLQHVVIPLREKMAAQKIAVALDFSKNDHKLIGHALGQGTKDSHYLLIHVVESPATRFLGDAADDMETRNDKERMEKFVAELREKGYTAEGMLGYNNRVKEIVRIVRQNRADLLVIGAHGHKGIRDMVYGQTVDEVRHALRIPVLIINI